MQAKSCSFNVHTHFVSALSCRGLYRGIPTWIHPPEVIPADSWRDEASGTWDVWVLCVCERGGGQPGGGESAISCALCVCPLYATVQCTPRLMSGVWLDSVGRIHPPEVIPADSWEG